MPEGYCLEKCLEEEDDGGALYGTSRSPDAESAGEPAAQPAVLKLVPGHSAAAGQLAAWERLAGLSHPNLLELVECGRTGPIGHPSGEYFLYAVFESPDDHLASALDAGLLTEADARDVLSAVEAGLHFLHAHGLAHTSVDPRHIVAVGDRIKLSGDTVKPLGPAATEAADWSEFNALRGRLLPDAAAPDSIPMASLETAPPESAPPVSLPPDAAPERRRGMPGWGYVALTVLLALVLLIATRQKSELQPHARPAPIVPAQAPAPAPPVAVARVPARPSEIANWRVVAYTYMRRKDADHKVAQINEKWPGFVAEVFSPSGGDKPPYLVSLGGRMTRAQAQTLQRQALADGLPRGTYAQNFKN